MPTSGLCGAAWRGAPAKSREKPIPNPLLAGYNGGVKKLVIVLILLALAMLVGIGIKRAFLSRKGDTADHGDLVRVELPDDSPPAAPAARPTLEMRVVETPRNWLNVHVQRDGFWQNLTQFDRPQNIFDAAASRDGKWVYVSHHEYPPRKLSIYDAETMKLVARFKPGVGGQFAWTPNNRIVLYFGFGTGD